MNCRIRVKKYFLQMLDTRKIVLWVESCCYVLGSFLDFDLFISPSIVDLRFCGNPGIMLGLDLRKEQD